MKKKLVRTLCMVTISSCILAACGKENRVNIGSTEVNVMTEVSDSQESATQQQVLEDVNKRAESPYKYVNEYGNSLILLCNDDSVKSVKVHEESDDLYINKIYEDNGNIFYVLCSSEDGKHYLYHLQDNLEPELINEYLGENLNLYGFYHGDFYHFDYTYPDENTRSFFNAECYDHNNGFAKVAKSIPFFEGVACDVEKYISDGIENLDKYEEIPVYNSVEESIEIYNFDGELVESIKPIDNINGYYWTFGGRYILLNNENMDYESNIDNKKYYWYDRETGMLNDLDEFNKDMSAFVHSIVGDTLYYNVNLVDSFIYSESEFRSYSFKDQKEISLFSEGKKAGVPFYNGSIFSQSNIQIDGDKGYFLLDTEKGLQFFTFETTTANTPVEVGEVLIPRDTSAYGTVDGTYEAYYTEDNENMVFEYYNEQFTFTKDYPGKDKMNEFLQSAADKNIEWFKKCGEDAIAEYDPEFGIPVSYSNNEFASVKEIGNTLVAVEMTGYEYTGGAHGYPTWNQYAFDRQTGELVTLEKLYKGNVEDFKKLVADYSLKDYQENRGVYFEATSDEEQYSSFYDNASLDMFTMFGDNELQIIYTPYEYGPYVSGYIIVGIPYEELGLDI